ncbi:MAG TPA: hypothetical protein VGB82_06975 [Alphaproteobacteria bacterium]
MGEYRWFFRNGSSLMISADRGRFLTDRDAVDWVVGLLNKDPVATAAEVWRGGKLISQNVRDEALCTDRAG